MFSADGAHPPRSRPRHWNAGGAGRRYLPTAIGGGTVGQLTRTGIGGFADLRNAYGASRTGTAFDEYFHTADFRQGVGQVGMVRHTASGGIPVAAKELQNRTDHAGRRAQLPRMVHLLFDRPAISRSSPRIRAPSTRLRPTAPPGPRPSRRNCPRR